MLSFSYRKNIGIDIIYLLIINGKFNHRFWFKKKRQRYWQARQSKSRANSQNRTILRVGSENLVEPVEKPNSVKLGQTRRKIVQNRKLLKIVPILRFKEFGQLIARCYSFCWRVLSFFFSFSYNNRGVWVCGCVLQNEIFYAVQFWLWFW